MRLRLLSNKLGSSSLKKLAVALSEAVGYKVWRSRKPNPKRKNILYGDCKDKLYQYQWFEAHQVPSVPFTTDKAVVCQLLAEGATVVARTLTKASEGKGIVLLESGEDVVSAPVYTKYLKKKREFRVHVYQETVVSVLEKRRKKGAYNGESKIRNTANGYVFCRENVTEPEGIRELALKASKVTDSHFKGVDIGYNEKLNQLFVIEVNSAPGMEGSTINDYVKVITS